MSAPATRNFRFPSREFKGSRWPLIGTGIFFLLGSSIALAFLLLLPHSPGWALEENGIILAAIGLVLGVTVIVLAAALPQPVLRISEDSVSVWKGERQLKNLQFVDVQEVYLVGRPNMMSSTNDYMMKDVHGNTIPIGGLSIYRPTNLVKAMLAERLPDGVAPEPWLNAYNSLT